MSPIFKSETTAPRATITEWQREIYNTNCEAGWWDDRDPNDPRDLVLCAMLIITEISEFVEALRRNKLADDHLPQYPSAHVELGDWVIRTLDLAGAMGIDLEEIMWEKLQYNRSRIDHTKAARLGPGGKAF